MAHLHAAAFPSSEAWNTKSFAELMDQKTVSAIGIEGDLSLAALILIQIVPPEAEILTLATAPTAQRQGLASSLVRAAHTVLNQRGVTDLLLDVAEDNTAALKFYARTGFIENGRRKNYYTRADGDRVDAILMSASTAGHG